MNDRKKEGIAVQKCTSRGRIHKAGLNSENNSINPNPWCFSEWRFFLLSTIYPFTADWRSS